MHEIEACLLANYKTMWDEISTRHSRLNITLLGLSKVNAARRNSLNKLISSSGSAIHTMIPNAESLMFSYKLLAVEDPLMRGQTPNADDVKWLKTHWNFLNDCNKYNLNTAAVYLTVLGIIGLSFVALIAISTAASIFLAPVMSAVVASAAVLSIAMMISLATLSITYMANTLLLRQESQQQSFYTKFILPSFHNNGKEHSHACIVSSKVK